jgi:signal transduction histidine kinase
MNRFANLAALSVITMSALTAQAAPVDDAKAMVDQAVALVASKGAEAAAKEFNAGGQWHQSGRYVVAVQYDGTMIAHSAVPQIVGKNMMNAKDAAGKEFVKETIAAVKAKGDNQMELRWANPDTKKIQDAVFVTRAVPGANIYVGSLVFK